jgi:hypothetical protein
MKIPKGEQREVILTRVTEQEKIILQSKMEAEGFHNMSEWLRFRLLTSMSTEQRVVDIHQLTKQIHSLLNEEKLRNEINGGKIK